jgi:2-phospho-L-lactate/phosphoenolpyruvate guanylyltransferase
MTATTDWHLVVPVKGGAAAKSRLHPPPGVAREELALALASDCLTACSAGMPVSRLLVVTSDRRAAEVARHVGAGVVPDPGRGLNAAVGAGVGGVVSTAGPQAPVAVLLGDLPALRAGDLTTALGAAAAYPLAVLPDAAGEGTVLLTALEGHRLVPRFGAASAARHQAAGHHRLDLALPRLRTDVDDDTSLAAAVRLGVGAATAAVLDGAATLPDMQASVHTFDEDSGAGSVLLDDGREVRFSGEVFAASALRHVRPGQRLSIEVAAEGDDISRLWLVGVGDDQTIG